MLTELLAAKDPLAAAAERLQFRADGIPARGQHPVVRVLGRCVAVGDCWEFQGWRLPRGYGQVRRNGRMEPAHRIVFTEIHGPLSPSTYVCHRCDNPPCCNPAHLFAGSVTDNNRDRQAKGRTRGLQPGSTETSANARKTHCIHGHAFDEDNTYRRSNGSRACRTCGNERKRRAA